MKEKLRIIPLGGVEEIGKNMTVFEYDNEIVVIDCGSIFPKEDMLGIDLVIPDITYLLNNHNKVKGYVITHGHEDHIGATPYVLRQVPAPIYATNLTLALINIKFREHRISNIPMHVVKADDEVKIGKNFTAKFIHVNHSIAGAVAIALTCPAGTVVISGDFKIDFTPIDGRVTDLSTLARLGDEGVLAFLGESTNVERSGYTMSERKVGETFNRLFEKARGRVIVAMFASNIHRIQMMVDNAVAYGRKICFIGRSMLNVTRVAMEIGELFVPAENLIEIDQVNNYPDEEIVVITTGSQGEPMSGLARMAFGEHRNIQIRPTDMVILSSTPIPGNEKNVSRILNQLYRCGAEVIYSALEDVHVSGHALQEELKIVHSLLKPQYFVPIHGEYRMLWQHAELAESVGTPPQNIVIPELGRTIAMNQDELSLEEIVPTGNVLVDGLGIGDVGNVVLRDRRHLSQDGLIIVVMALDREKGELLSGPDIISRGFVYVRENEDIIENTRELTRNILINYGEIKGRDWPGLKNKIKDDLRRYIFDRIKRNPMILPVIMEV